MPTRFCFKRVAGGSLVSAITGRSKRLGIHHPLSLLVLGGSHWDPLGIAGFGGDYPTAFGRWHLNKLSLMYGHSILLSLIEGLIVRTTFCGDSAAHVYSR